MTPQPMPDRAETLGEAGERIRAAVPIRAERATEDDCRRRNALVADALTARGVQPGEHAWYTALLVDGRITGVWANSVEEAVLDLTVWWGERCHWVVADPQTRLRLEYFPRGTRSATEADRRFPLGPPRRVRDQFAPPESLLDGLWRPAAVNQQDRRRA